MGSQNNLTAFDINQDSWSSCGVPIGAIFYGAEAAIAVASEEFGLDLTVYDVDAVQVVIGIFRYIRFPVD